MKISIFSGAGASIEDSVNEVVAAENDGFGPPGCDESPDPFQVALDIEASLACRVSGQVDCFGVAKMPELVVIGQAGATGPM